tara:strand:- start:283 stop:1476 length:1194 start_codon:yes stop_codon:yes gene_type:complete
MSGQIKLKHASGNGVIISAPSSNPAADRTLTLPSDADGVIAKTDASGNLTVEGNLNTSNINGGQLGYTRLTINGAMTIAQRGTSSTSTGYHTVDRFRWLHGTVDNSPTQAQVNVASGTTPYTLGFRKAYKLTNADQTSGAQASTVVRLQTKIEAQDIANSGWNYTSDSSYITFSFWIKSSVAQSFPVQVFTEDGTSYAYPFSTGSLSADTWTKVTKTIPGNSNLQFDNDNGTGLNIQLMAFMGTTYSGSVTLNQWAAYNSSARVPDMTSTWYTTNGSTLEVTGVQLEVGSTATAFQFNSPAQELLLCQRYYQQLGLPEDYATGFSNTYIYRSYYLPVQQRANGTGSVVSQCRYYSGSSGANFTPTVLPRIDRVIVRGSAITNARGFLDGVIACDAEL